MTTHMRPAIRYQMRDYFTSGLVLFAVNAILVSLVPIGLFSINVNDSASYSAYGFAAAIFMLVSGIVTARQIIRLCAQMGTSRKTAFLSLFPAAVIAALAIAAAGELLLIAAQMVFRGYVNIYFNDLYALIYVGFEKFLTPIQHGMSVLFSTCLMLACYGFGLFCTTLYWRLNKLGCIIGGIAMGVFFLVGLPEIFLHFEAQVMALMDFCVASPWNFMGVFLLTGAFFSVISWFLVRNVNIRAGSK